MRIFANLSAGIMMAASFTASADTAMSVSGNVVAIPCTVDADTVNKLVEFSPLQQSDLVNAGTGGEWRDFSLLIKNCPTGINKVTVKYTGNADLWDSSAWKNMGSAANVALRLTNANHSLNYSNGNIQQISVDTSTRSAEFPLSAKIFTPRGNAKAGTFAAVVGLEITWQ